MKFLADECVEWQVVEALRKDGHSVFYVVEMDKSIPDEEVLNKANSESAILITADKDFGEMVYQQKRIPVGIILIRLAGLSNALKAKLVAGAVKEHFTEFLGNFAVISLTSIRFRKLSP